MDDFQNRFIITETREDEDRIFIDDCHRSVTLVFTLEQFHQLLVHLDNPTVGDWCGGLIRCQQVNKDEFYLDIGDSWLFVNYLMTREQMKEIAKELQDQESPEAED